MTRPGLLLAAVAAMFAATGACRSGRRIRADMPELMTVYRDLHANPELQHAGGAHARQARRRGAKLGFAVTEKVGKTGVVAVLSNGAGPVLMIRADMDGLPIVEQTGLPFHPKVRAIARSGSRPA